MYTRIAICDTLSKGDINTAKLMILYLGKISNNQYKKVPSAVSKKKSYPLYRDIIARHKSKMDISIFPIFLLELEGNEIYKISEIINVIGYMIFYNPILATNDNTKIIINFT